MSLNRQKPTGQSTEMQAPSKTSPSVHLQFGNRYNGVEQMELNSQSNGTVMQNGNLGLQVAAELNNLALNCPSSMLKPSQSSRNPAGGQALSNHNSHGVPETKKVPVEF